MMTLKALSRRPRLTVDLDAIQCNYQTIVGQLRTTRCGAMVKSDAYGLGTLPISQALLDAGCRTFFVSDLTEGLALRTIIPRDSLIFLLHGLETSFKHLAIEHALIPVLNSFDQLAAWAMIVDDGGGRVPVAVHIDTGMSQLGFSVEDLARLQTVPDLLERLDLRMIMSHLVCAEDRGDDNDAQFHRFLLATSSFPHSELSMTNAAAMALDSRMNFDIVMSGSALYGFSYEPSLKISGLRAVASLHASVIQLRTISPGESYGYGRNFSDQQRTRIATLSAGYADGIPRNLCDGGVVYFGNMTAPVVGRVSMNLMTVDASEIPEDMLDIGMQAEIIGAHQSVEQIAHLTGTLCDELLVRLGGQCRRIYV